MERFITLCKNGNINELQKYYSTHQDINIHAIDEYAFRLSCENGHIEVAKWLIELSQYKNFGLINIHANNEYAFRYSCANGQLEVAKWLIELSHDKTFGLINIHACSSPENYIKLLK